MYFFEFDASEIWFVMIRTGSGGGTPELVDERDCWEKLEARRMSMDRAGSTGRGGMGGNDSGIGASPKFGPYAGAEGRLASAARDTTW